MLLSSMIFIIFTISNLSIFLVFCYYVDLNLYVFVLHFQSFIQYTLLLSLYFLSFYFFFRCVPFFLHFFPVCNSTNEVPPSRKGDDVRKDVFCHLSSQTQPTSISGWKISFAYSSSISAAAAALQKDETEWLVINHISILFFVAFCSTFHTQVS